MLFLAQNCHAYNKDHIIHKSWYMPGADQHLSLLRVQHTYNHSNFECLYYRLDWRYSKLHFRTCWTSVEECLLVLQILVVWRCFSVFLLVINLFSTFLGLTLRLISYFWGKCFDIYAPNPKVAPPTMFLDIWNRFYITTFFLSNAL